MSNKGILLGLLLVLLTPPIVSAQKKLDYYLVYWKTSKENNHKSLQLSETAIQRRRSFNVELQANDYSIDPQQIKFLSSLTNVQQHGHSRWLNASMIACDSSNVLLALSTHDAIERIEYMGSLPKYGSHYQPKIAVPDSYYLKGQRLAEIKRKALNGSDSIFSFGANQKAYQLLNVKPFTSSKLLRQPYIAVLDAGFYNAYQIKGNEDLLNGSTVIYDFVEHDTNVWEDDAHGANVLALMKTYDTEHYMGSSPFAQYALFRTENTHYESPVEAFNWVLAAEKADSLGCDAIVSSLGYNQFDDANLGYAFAVLDGQSSLAAKAANIAFQKGILVIVSAGNDGDTKWHHISTPGDAAMAITVGACNYQYKHALFSSFGPNAKGMVKPDLLAPGQGIVLNTPFGYKMGNGTSYSTPILAGLLCNILMQRYQSNTFDLSFFKSQIQMASSHTFKPDSAYGYGIPDLDLAQQLVLQKPYRFGLWPDQKQNLNNSLTLHFYSNQAQKINIQLMAFDKHQICIKKSSKKHQGIHQHWHHFNDAIQFYESLQLKSSFIKSITINIQSEQGSFSRTIDF